MAFQMSTTEKLALIARTIKTSVDIRDAAQIIARKARSQGLNVTIKNGTWLTMSGAGGYWSIGEDGGRWDVAFYPGKW